MKITTQQQADAVEVQLIAADALKAANMQIPGDSQTLDEYRTALAAWKRRDEFDPANVGELSETAKHYFAWTNLTDEDKYVLVQWDCGHTGEHILEELKPL